MTQLNSSKPISLGLRVCASRARNVVAGSVAPYDYCTGVAATVPYKSASAACCRSCSVTLMTAKPAPRALPHGRGPPARQPSATAAASTCRASYLVGVGGRGRGRVRVRGRVWVRLESQG